MSKYRNITAYKQINGKYCAIGELISRSGDHPYIIQREGKSEKHALNRLMKYERI
jgi:hypothetical protein